MLLLIGAIACWGFANFFMKIAVTTRTSPLSAFGWEITGGLFVVFVIFFWEQKGLYVEDLRGTFWAFFGGMMMMCGGYLFLIALPHVKLSIAMPFSALNVLVSALLGVLILGERLNSIQSLAAGGMIICSVLLGISSQNK